MAHYGDPEKVLDDSGADSGSVKGCFYGVLEEMFAKVERSQRRIVNRRKFWTDSR